MVDLWHLLTSEKHGMPSLPNKIPDALASWDALTFDDMWAEAKMNSVCHWLRGGKNLQIPPEFRGSLPTKL